MLKWLRQHVAQANEAHPEVSVLWVRRHREPRASGYVGSLGYQQHSTELRIAPESLGPIDGAFLDRAVLNACRRGRCAEASNADERRASCGEIAEGVALEVGSTIVEAQLRFARLSLNSNQRIAGMNW